MIRAAVRFAEIGLHIFPCVPRTKVPATEHGVKDATTDLEIIKAWWHERPDCNIAIATGAASGIFVLDVDGAELELHCLETKYGGLPATVEVVTPRGRHIYFKMPDVPVRNSAGKIAEGVDVRGEGGYVLERQAFTQTAALTCGRSTARLHLQRRHNGCWPRSPSW